MAAAHDAAVIASAQAKQSTAAKDEATTTLVDLMKANLRYAESITRFDGGKLELIGWNAPRNRTPTGMPGQVRTLEVLRQGKGWLFLDWKEPVDGGQPAAYKVQRRRPGATDWTDVGMAVESEITLNGQEPGVEFEYHVIAVNKAGEGPASNIVRAVRARGQDADRRRNRARGDPRAEARRAGGIARQDHRGGCRKR